MIPQDGRGESDVVGDRPVILHLGAEVFVVEVIVIRVRGRGRQVFFVVY